MHPFIMSKQYKLARELFRSTHCENFSEKNFAISSSTSKQNEAESENAENFLTFFVE